MSRSIRRLGLVGATLAIVLIAGLNFAAIGQWDVLYLGVQEAHAWGHCQWSFDCGQFLCTYQGYYEVLFPCEWYYNCYGC